MADINATILVVDDDEDVRIQARMYLESEGYTVIEATSEVEALDVIEKGGFDLAVLDLMMENKDSGFILAHRVKKLNPEIPVIMVTAVTSETSIHFDATTRQEKEWIKVDSFLEKKIRKEQLLREVTILLDK
ncbi:MAG: response regulator [Fibrobacterales bacterium]